MTRRSSLELQWIKRPWNRRRAASFLPLNTESQDNQCWKAHERSADAWVFLHLSSGFPYVKGLQSNRQAQESRHSFSFAGGYKPGESRNIQELAYQWSGNCLVCRPLLRPCSRIPELLRLKAVYSWFAQFMKVDRVTANHSLSSTAIQQKFQHSLSLLS